MCNFCFIYFLLLILLHVLSEKIMAQLKIYNFLEKKLILFYLFDQFILILMQYVSTYFKHLSLFNNNFIHSRNFYKLIIITMTF